MATIAHTAYCTHCNAKSYCICSFNADHIDNKCFECFDPILNQPIEKDSKEKPTDE